jgi:hypothetical protein
MTAKRLLPLTGILAVAAVVVAFIIGGEPPDVDSPVQEIKSFYVDSEGEVIAGGVLLAYAAIFFLIFATVLRGVLRRAEGDAGGFSALSFAGAILFAVGLALFSGFSFVLGDSAKDLDPSSVQAIHALGDNLFVPVAVGTVTFLLGTGISAIKTGALPKWLAWIGIVVGITGVTPIGFVAFIGVGVWILITSVLLAMRAEAA